MPDSMRRIALASRPEGEVAPGNFRLEEGPVPTPGDGEAVVRVIWLSLDPYMRGRMDASKSYAAAVEIGGTMEGGAVGQVIASRAAGISEGDFVNGRFGWASHAVAKGAAMRKLDPDLAPISTAVGVLGMPGFTGWWGLTQIGRPKSGETLVVGAATGAVGSMVGQLGRIRGMRTVGVAGGPEKCAYAVEELGFDACLDHRDGDAKALRGRIAEAAPDGVDVYFENVGGKTLDAVIPLMNVGARIPICGMISQYDMGGLGMGEAPGPNLLPRVWRTLLVQRILAQGFIISDHFDRLDEFLAEVGPQVKSGEVRYRESIAEGLENAPSAFMALLKGGNFGKQLVAVSNDPTR